MIRRPSGEASAAVAPALARAQHPGRVDLGDRRVAERRDFVRIPGLEGLHKRRMESRHENGRARRVLPEARPYHRMEQGQHGEPGKPRSGATGQRERQPERAEPGHQGGVERRVVAREHADDIAVEEVRG